MSERSRDEPVRVKHWEQQGGLALWAVEEGEVIPYQPITSLDQVSEILEKLNCANITKVMDGNKLVALEWMVDYDRFLGMSLGEIAPRTLTFSLDENGSLQYLCSVESLDFKSDENGRIPNNLDWSGDPKETFSQAMATYYFLFPFAQEQHAVLAPTDTFDFQFSGTEDEDVDVRVRIGGVKFAFVPNKRLNAPLSGEVTIEVPAEVSS